MEKSFTNPKSLSRTRFLIYTIQTIALIGFLGTIAYFSAEKSPAQWKANFSQAVLQQHQFQNFLKTYSKSYKSDSEYYERLLIFKQNLAFIRNQNSKGNDWTLGVNKFADQSFTEFRTLHEPKVPLQYKTSTIRDKQIDTSDLPTTVDWRNKYAVTDVKDQGDCNSCWAFAVTAAIQGVWAIDKGSLESYSEQQLVDCSGDFGNYGCNGGVPANAYEYVIKNGGITSYMVYPYKEKAGTCMTSLESQVKAKITNYVTVTSGYMSQMQASVAKQPVAVTVQSDQSIWQFYIQGTITKACGTDINHSVTIVGYDSTQDTPYWIVKNSWGTDWGIDGYVQIKMTEGSGVCGINLAGTYPLST